MVWTLVLSVNKRNFRKSTIKNKSDGSSNLFLFSDGVTVQTSGKDYRIAVGLWVGESCGFTFNLNTGRASG